jgi:Ca2+-transporting ATPase
MRQSILRQNEELAAEGLRILGFAQRHDGSLKTAPLSDLHWLGLVGLEDPLRAGAGELVSSFQEAGIRPLILTGDQASTAKALAARLGVSNDGSLDVVDAAELHELSDEEVAALALRAEVFARVTPGDKLRIVQALQAGGHVVAMTGDGVNDGPALRAADIGIAMGRSGSQITKDVADVVIAEDGLAGIASFLAHGRAAEENIRRSLRFLLGTNASEVILLLLEAISGANELETPFELLWLNLVTDVFPALGLAHAGPADDVLKRQPRPANHLLLDRREYGALAGAATSMAMQGMTAHILGMARYGIGPRARGMTLLALGAAHLSHTLMLAPQRGKRTSETLLSRWGVEAGVAASAALLLAPYAIRPLGRLLGIARPRMSDMALSLTIAGAPLAMHLLKQLRPDPQPEPMIGWRPGRASD